MKAFPLTNMTGLNQQGMDLRDYFAAKAMQTLFADKIVQETADENGVPFPRLVAMLAYDMADIMMGEREVNNE